MIKIEVPEYEEKLSVDESKGVPRKPGVYALYGENDELLYIGKTQNLYLRLRQHCLGNDPQLYYMWHNIEYFCYWIVDDPTEREIYETWMINTMKPPWNRDKVYTYKSDRDNPKYRDPDDLAEEIREKEEAFQRLAAKIRALDP